MTSPSVTQASAQWPPWPHEPQRTNYNWLKNEKLPKTGLANPYSLSASELKHYNRQGRLHALHYPVEVTGALLPYNAFLTLLQLVKADYRTMNTWLGLHEYPVSEGQGPYFVPFKDGTRPEGHMGFSIIEYQGVKGFTQSCAACHSANLFGQKIIGLTNRFPRANEFFHGGKKALFVLDSSYLKSLTNAPQSEIDLYLKTKENLRSVEAKKPKRLGLDTSLAHVALSLSRREKDEWATKSKRAYSNPSFDGLRHYTSDSKPAVWWNVKYKNKWLLDGSVVAGNPILTNILWNEIGRGTDLKVLNEWFKNNSQVIKELTTAVYQAQAPHITDFFEDKYFDINAAQRGEKHFQNMCSRCHGVYVKNWSLPHASDLSLKEKLKTFKVEYFEDTPVKDVGTDPQRWHAMKSLVQLNDLKISKDYGILIEVQKGYVPPPLEGIWARYPYFHNNSAPTLCDVLLPVAKRAKTYLAREAHDKNKDFDFNCNGYPRVRRIERYEASKYFFDTRDKGLSNSGHEKMLFDQSGREILSTQDRQDLIRFLQTL